MQNRTGTPAPGDSTAYLAEVKERQMRAKLCSAHRFPQVGCSLCGEAATHGSADLGCLVAALEAVLGLADEWEDSAAIECPADLLRVAVSAELPGKSAAP